jgi:PGF-CTERM protein
VPVEQEFVIGVEQGPVLRDQVRGVVVRPASITVVEDVYGGDEEVSLDEVTLPRGGFAAVVVGGDRVLGATDPLDPGTYEDVTVALEEPIDPARNTVLIGVYEDVDGDGELDVAVDRPYRLPAGEVTSVVAVRKQTAGQTDTGTPTPTSSPTGTPTQTVAPTSTPTSTETATQTGTADPTTTASGGGGPGFGVVAALLAVAALVLLWRRE